MEITADSAEVPLTTKIVDAVHGAVNGTHGTEVPVMTTRSEGSNGDVKGSHDQDITEKVNGASGTETPLVTENNDAVEEVAYSSDSYVCSGARTTTEVVEEAGNGSKGTKTPETAKDIETGAGTIDNSKTAELPPTVIGSQEFSGLVNGDKDTNVPLMEKTTESIRGVINGAAESASYIVPAIINGKDVVTSSTFDVIAPRPNKFLHKCSSVSIEEALQAVEAAERAFPAWRDTLPGKRRDIFLKAAEIVEQRAAELGKYMEEETGSASFWAEGFNVPVSADSLKDIAGRIGGLAGSIPTMADVDRTALIFKEPFGVIMGIAPWNAPYILGFRSIAYAIAAGNTAILKASELSPRCSWAIGDCFREAGLPDGVLNVIAHRPSDAAAVTKALIEHPSLKKLNFTGSTMVGKIIGKLAGENLKPVLLELGGKAPAIVWDDADLKLAAHECAVGAFLHTGQVCMATERIIVHKNVASQFEEEVKAAAKEMFSEAGVMVNKIGVEKNKRLVKDALSKGATLVYGNAEVQDSETRMSAVILKNVTPQMDIYLTESFGPSVSMYVIETEEEALKLANDTDYGLHAAIFTEDLRRALRMAKSIETGAVHINAMTIHDEPALPHGGVKGSGYGRFGSMGLEEWVKTKTVTFKK